MTVKLHSILPFRKCDKKLISTAENLVNKAENDQTLLPVLFNEKITFDVSRSPTKAK